MFSQLHIPVNRPRINRWMVALLLAYTTLMFMTLQTYIAWQSVNVLLGLISLPVVTVIDPYHKRSLRYAVMALILAMLSFWVPVKTMLYGVIVFAGFFIVETFIGKTNLLPLFVVGLMSPVCQYFANVFSFPVRLQLTNWAGRLMNLVTPSGELGTTVKGNMILYNGNEFSVDPACMGLNMIITSLLIQVILVAVYQKRNGVRLAWWHILLLMGIITGLNIISNIFRIICLVRFNILPETFMHEFTGIICLLVYVVLPATFITRIVVSKFGRKPGPTGKFTRKMTVPKLAAWHTLLLAFTICAAIRNIQFDDRIHNATALVISVPGYSVQRLQSDIIKLNNEQSLIYIKTISGFYNSDHNPMICWRGSGYEFQQVEEQSIGNTKIYTGILRSDSAQLYTAWWYDNGTNRTIEQLTWRWDVLKGANKYSVVNITAPGKEQLIVQVKNILQDNRLQQLLKSTNR